ncbi:MAG: chorismate mutase [Clostridia bacterium]|nr:chorismate mutase [Clostridia bacterium]
MDALKDIRKIINECDKKIIENLSLRFSAVEKVTEIKKREKLPIFDSKREKEIIQSIMNKEMSQASYAAEIYEQILKISRKFQAQNLLPKKIFLIGFMGSGKSTIGKQLSDITGFQWVDTDSIIEEKMEMKISKIFSKKGEKFFRKIEAQVLQNIEDEENQIISCGGGIILKEENRKFLKEKGKIVFLHGDIKTMLDRIEYDDNRPVLFSALRDNSDKKYEAFKDILDKRMPLYLEAADVTIEIEKKHPEEIAKEIINELI